MAVLPKFKILEELLSMISTSEAGSPGGVWESGDLRVIPPKIVTPTCSGVLNG